MAGALGGLIIISSQGGSYYFCYLMVKEFGNQVGEKAPSDSELLMSEVEQDICTC